MKPDTPDIFMLMERFLRGFITSMVCSVKKLDVPGAPQDMKILMLIAQKPSIAISEIVDETVRDKSQITRKIKDLEGRGLIVRTTHETDKRISQLHLTTQGDAMAAKLKETKKRVLSEMLQPLNTQERHDLARLLNKILSASADDKP